MLGSDLALYDYFLKDHMGNVRATITDEQQLDVYPKASMETAAATTEESFYSNLSETRTARPSGFPADPADPGSETPTPPTDDYVAGVRSSSGFFNIGPSITLKVMAGDTFNVKVDSWYKTNGTSPGSAVNPLSDIVSAMITGVSGSAILNTHSATETTLGDGGAFTDVSSFLSNQDGAANASKPKAYLNWVLFDEQFKLVSSGSGFEQVGADTTLTHMVHTNLPVAKSGYLYIYVNNETPNITVYFDNLQVSHKRGPLLETSEYYPYGMQAKNISYRAAGAMVTTYRSNGGNEVEEEAELNYNMTFYRKYDAQIGRFTGVDIYAEKYVGVNPYQFGAGNPIFFNDPLGDKETVSDNANDNDIKFFYDSDGSWNSFMKFIGSTKSGGGGTSSDNPTSLITIINDLKRSNFGGSWVNNSDGTGTTTYFQNGYEAFNAGAAYMSKYSLWGKANYATSRSAALRSLLKKMTPMISFAKNPSYDEPGGHDEYEKWVRPVDDPVRNSSYLLYGATFRYSVDISNYDFDYYNWTNEVSMIPNMNSSGVVVQNPFFDGTLRFGKNVNFPYYYRDDQVSENTLNNCTEFGDGPGSFALNNSFFAISTLFGFKDGNRTPLLKFSWGYKFVNGEYEQLPLITIPLQIFHPYKP